MELSILGIIQVLRRDSFRTGRQLQHSLLGFDSQFLYGNDSATFRHIDEALRSAFNTKQPPRTFNELAW